MRNIEVKKIDFDTISCHAFFKVAFCDLKVFFIVFKVKCFGLEGTESKKIIIFYNFHVGIKSFSANNDQEVFYMPKENKKEKELTVVPEIDEKWFKDHIYEIRGQKVMLDSDLAVVYGYETMLKSLKMISCSN